MDIDQKRYMKLFLILLCLAVFMSPGCKGKEEKQPVTESPISEQQAKEDAPEKPAINPGPSETNASGGGRNMPPKITSLDLSPRIPVRGDTIKAIVTTFDNEGDTVNLTYEWARNNSSLSESSDSLLLTDNFRSGDKITLRVIPDDGVRKGTPVSVVITIANASPVIHPSQETFKFDGSFYSYQVKASDADGDPLTYSLKSSPPGMTINSKTGLVEWNVPADFKGKAPITIMVSDGRGGEVLQSFTLEIKEEQKK